MGTIPSQQHVSIGHWSGGHHAKLCIATARCMWTRQISEKPSILFYQLSIIAILLVIGGIEMNPGPGPAEWCCCCCSGLFGTSSQEKYDPVAQESYPLEQTKDLMEQEKRKLLEQGLKQQIRQEIEQELRKEIEQEMRQQSGGSSRTQEGNQNGRGPQWNQEENTLHNLKQGSENVENFANASYFHRQQSGSSPLQYDRRTGTSDMTGELFEVNVASLLFIRGMFETDGFHLATNVDHTGAFDDLVFKFKDRRTQLEHSCFLQLKTKSSSLITQQALCAPTGDFSLLKYYASYCEIEKEFSSQAKSVVFEGSFQNCEFIIYTNTKVACDSSWHEIASNGGTESILCSGGNRGKVFCLKLGSDEDTKTFDFLKLYEKELEVISKGNLPLNKMKSKLEKFKQLTQCKELLKTLQKGNDFKTLLNDQLRDVGDRKRWEQFLKKLKVYTSQAIEGELEALVKQNLETYCGMSGTRTQEMFTKLKECMIEWWRRGNYLLTDSCVPFWNNIMEEHIFNLVAPLYRDMAGVTVLRFQVTQDVLHRGQVTHIATEGTTKLSCLKIQQNLVSVGHIMVDGRTLNTRLREVLALWGRGTWYNVLVIEGGSDDQDTITGVAGVLQTCPGKQVVIIAAESNHMARKLCKMFQCKVYKEKFSFTQLDDKSQKIILESKVNFQGHYISLKSLAGRNTLKGTITSDVIVDLLSGDLKVGQKLDKSDECYISRILLRRELVDKGILTVKGPDHFAISGTSVKELQQLVPPGESVMKFANTIWSKNRNCRYFVINNIADFTKLFSLHGNVHWLDKRGEDFRWKISKGDMIFVKKQATNLTYDNVKKVMDLSDDIVVIVAEPGMGKSTELSHLASEVKCLDPTMWVVKVDLNDHTDFLSRSKSTALELLMQAGNFIGFQRTLFEHELNHGGNVVVMFDGFDEISPKYGDKVIDILKELRQTKIKKLWVTSRPVMRDSLEQAMLTLSFDFKPFSVENQKEFLLKFWKMESSKYDINIFINKLLILTNRSLNDSRSTFTGVPLQTRMLAEAFLNEVNHYGNTGEVKLPYKLDLLQLYSAFVDRKWQIHYSEKSGVDITKAGISDIYEDLRRVFHDNLMNCALVTLLDHDEIKKLHNSNVVIKKCNKFLQRFKLGQDKTGIIVDVADEKAQFIHRTFAEYFVALWFSENFQLHSKYLMEKYFHSTFRVIIHFLDRILAQKFDLHVAVLNHDKLSVETLLSQRQVNVNDRDDGGRTALHLAVLCYTGVQHDDDCDKSSKIIQQIIKILLEHGADPNIEDRVLCWRPLRIADRIRAWAAVDLLLEKGGNSIDLVLTRQNITDPHFVKEVLLLASAQGLVHIVKFMIQSQVSVEHRIGRCGSTMLHEAASHGQLSLCKSLLLINADLEARDTKYKRTPLMWAAEKGCLHVVEYFIEQGAKVISHDNNGNTALLMAAERGQLEVFKALSQHDTNTDVRDILGNTVLHLAAMSGNTELVRHILDVHTLDIDCYNNTHHTSLWRAAGWGQLEVTRLLCERGANLQIKDTVYGWTPLHVAAFWGDLQVVQYLVQSGASLIAYDYKGRKPLDVAIEWHKPAVAEFLHLAIKTML